MARDASSVDAVRRFAAALHNLRSRLLVDLFPIADIADLLAAVRSRGELPREGRTRSGIECTVHGAGCRMISSDGREVDIDLVTDPLLGREVEAFDAWRIRWYLDEAAEDSHSNEEIVAACTRLASEGHLREVVGSAGSRFLTLQATRHEPPTRSDPPPSTLKQRASHVSGSAAVRSCR